MVHTVKRHHRRHAGGPQRLAGLAVRVLGWGTVLAGWPALAVATNRWLPAPADWYQLELAGRVGESRILLHTLTIAGWLLWIWLVRELVVAIRHARRASGPVRRWKPPGRRHYTAAAVTSSTVLLVDTLLRAGTAAAQPAPATQTPSEDTPTEAPPPPFADEDRGDEDAIDRHPAVRFFVGGRLVLGPADFPEAFAVAASSAAGSDSDAPAWARNAPGGIYHVVKGDNLWNIAKDKLSDPYRWREIYALNRGRPQDNGYALRDPNKIHIGWVLMLPERHPNGSGASGADDTDQPPATPQPQTHPEPTTPSTPASPTAPVSTPPTSAAPNSGIPTSQEAHHGDVGHGVRLPSHGWVSLGLAAAIAAVAGLLRLQHRRRARLGFPVALSTGPAPAPVPDSLRAADAAGNRQLTIRPGGPLPDVVPEPPGVPAPIGVNEHGDEISLFEVPGLAVNLDGDDALAAARAIAATVLTTSVTDHQLARPVLVTTADLLALLLPDGADVHGLDPYHETFDGERLIVVADAAAGVTHLETEMIHRRRLLDDMGLDSADELNARTDHVEHLAPCVLLVPAEPRHTARILAVATHRWALELHPVIVGALPDTTEVTHLHVRAGGAVTIVNDAAGPADVGRLAVLAARDLADVLAMVAAVASRPEPGDEPNDPITEADGSAFEIDLTDIPARSDEAATPPPARLSVLGPPALATTDAPITSGVRRGSLAVLAVLAAHPKGRTFEELAADLHPDADTETGINRVRTDLNAVRSLLRDATGIEGRGKFIVHDATSGRYRIDPKLIEVDLWQMLSALDQANKAGDDETCLAALRQAVAYYRGDFAEGQDRAWVIDYATTYRHQILSAYARIAEILETDQPDQAIAALNTAIEHDPVNEELYQRVMRIHGRLARPDAVRRTLRLLENRLAELCDAEPSEATRRIATRQLTPTLTGQR